MRVSQFETAYHMHFEVVKASEWLEIAGKLDNNLLAQGNI
jgi:hypothetical protein